MHWMEDLLPRCPKELRGPLEKKIENTMFDGLQMSFVDEKLTLSFKEQSYFCDFLSSKFIKEVRQNHSRSESVYEFLKPFQKKNHQKSLKILDLTAGLGRDLFKFVLAGHEVVAYERDPVLYLLLKDGVERFFSDEKTEELKKKFHLKKDFSLRLHFGDSKKALSAQPNQSNQPKTKEFDLIYYDPMYDDHGKKASPKKPMQVVQSLTIDFKGDNKEHMVELALKKAHKVVLKTESSKDLKKLCNIISKKPERQILSKHTYFIWSERGVKRLQTPKVTKRD